MTRPNSDLIGVKILIYVEVRWVSRKRSVKRSVTLGRELAEAQDEAYNLGLASGGKSKGLGQIWARSGIEAKGSRCSR